MTNIPEQENRKNGSETKKMNNETAYFEDCLAYIGLPIDKQGLIDFFESDKEKFQSMLDAVDEFDDVVYHSFAQLVNEYKRVKCRKT